MLRNNNLINYKFILFMQYVTLQNHGCALVSIACAHPQEAFVILHCRLCNFTEWGWFCNLTHKVTKWKGPSNESLWV